MHGTGEGDGTCWWRGLPRRLLGVWLIAVVALGTVSALAASGRGTIADASSRSSDDEPTDDTSAEGDASGDAHAGAAVGRDLASACPDDVADPGFADVPVTSAHHRAVACLVHWQISSGTGIVAYAPGAALTRGQMASLLARAVQRSGATLPPPVEPGFADTAASVHEHAVRRLASAGIVRGTSPASFSPDALVSRAQLASFLVRAVEWRRDLPLPDGADRFHDVGKPFRDHARAIAAGAEAGLVTGTGDRRFEPGGDVTRGQAASLVARALALLVDEQHAAVPPPPVVPPLSGRRPTAEDPLRVLLVGDSMTWDAALGVEAALEATGVVDFTDGTRLGFGLIPSWAQHMWHEEWPQLLRETRADVVVVLYGGWDIADIERNGLHWYGDRVDQAAAVLRSTGAKVLWLGFPRSVERDGTEVNLVVNEVFRHVGRAFPGVMAYLDSSPALAPTPPSRQWATDPDGSGELVRKTDGVHVCPDGGARLGELILSGLAAYELPAPAPGWRNGPWRRDGRYTDPDDGCDP